MIVASPTSISLHSFFAEKAKTIFREPSGCLRHPFLVPGGTYAFQLWDWDSFWMAKGLLRSAQDDPTQKALYLEYAIGSWKNFFENQAPNGCIPILITPENEDVFGCATAPSQNQAKPVMAQFALEVIKASGEVEWIKPYFPGLLKFLRRWEEHYSSACGLLAWGSDVAIGVDNDPATYGRPEFSSGSLLLNCLYYKDLIAAEEIAGMLQETSMAHQLGLKAAAVKKAIQDECWDETDGFYYSVDVQCKDQRDKYLAGIPQGMDTSWQTLPLKIKSFTGFLPMWCGIATRHQAELIVERHWRNPDEFISPYGIRSLARCEKMYDTRTDSSNPSNWLGPIWILSNFLVYTGLQNYGYRADAQSLARKTNDLLLNDVKNTGSVHECYNPDNGQSNFNLGFYSWNILALLMT